MSNKTWPLTTRLLHGGLVLTVSAQLFISLIMNKPGNQGSEWGQLAFETHGAIGLIALGIVLAHWIWSLINQFDGGLDHLFPWHGQARQRVIDDLRQLLRGQLPEGGVRGGLPGLGLLAVTGMAMTGAVLFVILPEIGKPGAIAQDIMEIHEVIAGLVWAYWLGHGFIAIVHHLSGHDTVRQMFSFRNNKNNTSKVVPATIQARK